MRTKPDTAIGSRWDSDFVNTQCFYVPPMTAPSIVGFYGSWPGPRDGRRRDACFDLGLADWLRAQGLRYWLHVPSLVQHRADVRSAVGHARNRISATFTDPDI